MSKHRYNETTKVEKELKEKTREKRLLLTERVENIPDSNFQKYNVVEVSASELSNNASFCRRLMRNQGIQELPRIFWLNEDGNIENERVN